MGTFRQNFNFKIKEHGKISYERQVYESADDRSLSFLGYIFIYIYIYIYIIYIKKNSHEWVKQVQY